MHNLFELIKVNLRETLDVRKFKEEKGKMISFLVVILLAGIIGVVISSAYSILFGEMFLSFDVPIFNNVLFMASLCSVLIFSTSVFSIKGIFMGRDFEILQSMPIPKTTILISKLISLYIVSILFSLLLLLPNGIITSILSSDGSYVLFSFIYILFIPAMPLLAATILSLFITLIADRFRFGNIISMILYVLMFVAIFLLSFISNSSAEGLLSTVSVMSWINPVVQLIRYTHEVSYMYSLAFIGCNLLILGIVTFLITILFNPVYNSIHSYRSNTKYVRKTLEVKGQFKTLFSLESKRYFTSKLYMINTIMSGIFAIIMCVAVVVASNSIKEVYADMLQKYAFIGYIVIVFAIGIATPATCAINIEGKNFWIIKSYPIDPKTSIKAKLSLSVLVLGVCSIISSIILIVIFKPDVFSSILLVILPLLYIVLISEIGLFINLYFYNLKWKSEHEAVKKSVNVFIGMIIDIALSIILLALSIGFAIWNVYASGIITLLVLALASIALYLILMHVAERKYEQIEL